MGTKKLGFDIECTKQKDMRGRIRGFRAKFGHVEVTGSDAIDAVEGVRKAVVALVSEPLSPTVLWSLDRREVWITVPSHDGTWGYEIHRPHVHEGVHHYSRATTVDTCATREEAIERMRAHYYDVWIRPIVQGLVGLFTDWREWVCPRCKSPSRSQAPYRCQNPACGHTVEEARAVRCDGCGEAAEETEQRADLPGVKDGDTYRAPWLCAACSDDIDEEECGHGCCSIVLPRYPSRHTDGARTSRVYTDRHGCTIPQTHRGSSYRGRKPVR